MIKSRKALDMDLEEMWTIFRAGALPGVFKHSRLGTVDVYVMCRPLDDIRIGPPLV